MEQINSILDLMEITFQNGVPSNAGWLINIIAKSHRTDSFDLTTLKYTNKYA